MKKIIIALLVVLVVLLIFVAGFLYWKGTANGSDYYAVYLDTGDIYFGKLSRFPYLSLSNVWYLNKDSQTQNLALSKFKESVWGPEDKIKINNDKVVWIVKLSSSSQVLNSIRENEVTQ
ncbi:MAG: hypothetical protein WC705_00970 [Candidatus Paceibacterota bacterium]|jgi:hypothetical protein